MPDLTLLDGSTVPLDKNPYREFTAGITFSPKDLLGRELKDEDEAEAFRSLADIFFGSEFVYEGLKGFITAYFVEQLKIVKTAKKDIVPSSNGEDNRL